jgi:hypothetical protein
MEAACHLGMWWNRWKTQVFLLLIFPPIGSFSLRKMSYDSRSIIRVFLILTLGPKVPLHESHYADQLLKMFLNIGAS